VEEVFGRSSTRDLLRLRRDLLTASGRAADAAKLLLAGNRFDLTWLTFSAGHVAGHQFWDLSQVDGVDGRGLDGATRQVLSGALEEVYQSVDAGFGRVLAALPDDADVIVVSPVGMDVNTSRADLLPEYSTRSCSAAPAQTPAQPPGRPQSGSCARPCRPVCGPGSRPRCRTESRWP
jgi:hypothetical protein